MNRRGSSGEGGVACKVEPKSYHLTGTDFLRAMVGDVGYRAAKNINQTKAGDEKTAKN